MTSIGLSPNKSKTIGSLVIPDKYFPDFLRGYLDGDGYTSSFQDSVFKNSFRLYTGFVSASETHLIWLRNQIRRLYLLEGSLLYSKQAHVFSLKYAKKASSKLLPIIYYKKRLICLSRKRFKIEQALGIISNKPQ